MPTEPVLIYVRKGVSDLERRITFARPEGLSSTELLDAGIAIDGNAAMLSVVANEYKDRWYYHSALLEDADQPQSFADALALTEGRLVDFLRERGFESTFN